MTSPEREPQPDDGHGPSPTYVSSQFTEYCRRRDVVILDVVRGAAADTRRLQLGHPAGDEVSLVVAVAHGTRGLDPVRIEETVLQQAHGLLRPEIRRSIPRVQGRVEVHAGLEGLVMTGVPGLRVAGRRWTTVRVRALLATMPRWLGAVWADTADGMAQVDLGAADMHTVLAEQDRAPRLGPAMDAVRRARLRLAQYDVPQTLTHGCLCPRHVTVTGGRAGVDDWGLASTAGDPLRDLGRFAVNLAGGRLPEVLAGRSGFAGDIRQFLGAALAHTPVPPQLWREVMVLAQLELAMESLDRADPNGMQLLSRAVRLCGALTRTR